MSEQQILNEIIQYIHKEGYNYSSWYVGIASDPKDRLFNEHNVDENSWWIYRQAESSQSARNVEELIIKTYHTDGGTGGGDHSTKYVYAYKKTSTTNP